MVSFERPRKFLQRMNPRPVAIFRRCLRSGPITAALCAVLLARGSPASAATATKYDFGVPDVDSKTYNPNAKADEAKFFKVVGVVAVPIVIKSAIDQSKKRKEREMTRVKGAIERLEVMRDEFMNVEGKASTDENMFASLQDRTKEIEEEAEEQAAVDAQEAADDAEALKKAKGVEDLFSFDDEDDEDKGVSSKKKNKKEDKDEDEDAPALASTDDVERLKRMFGSS